MDEYLGIIKLFAGTYAPQNYMMCNGQLLSIAQYTALYSLIGTIYGGDGRVTFALPNLQGMVAVGAGASSSGSRYEPGQIGGTETTQLKATNIPPHTHTAKFGVSSANATASVATNNSVIATPGSNAGRQFNASLGFNEATPDMALSPSTVTIGVTGGGEPIGLMQPFLAMNYIICVNGLWPPRP